METNIKQIKSIPKLLLLHLMPGAVITMIYIIFIRTMDFSQYPRLVPFSVAGLIGIVVFELGYVMYKAKKEKGSFDIRSVIGLQSKVSWKECVIYGIVLFFTGGIIFTIFPMVDRYILKNLFGWVPQWYSIEQNIGNFSKLIIFKVILMNFFLMATILPIIEEIYFRGYLLSRMRWMGKAAPWVNTILFSLYHFWTPWQTITRILAVFPLVYVGNKKDNIVIPIIVHCSLNLVSNVVFLIPLLFR